MAAKLTTARQNAGHVLELAGERQYRRTRGAAGALLTVSIATTFSLAIPFTMDYEKTVFGQWGRPAVQLAALTHGPIPVCYGGNRAARKVTCLVDGDTGWENGVKWRLLDIDAPELSHSGCPSESATAIAARDRLQSLMSDGYRIGRTGSTGYYGRALVNIMLADGRDAGQVLLKEGLAQPWPNHGNKWCRG